MSRGCQEVRIGFADGEATTLYLVNPRALTSGDRGHSPDGVAGSAGAASPDGAGEGSRGVKAQGAVPSAESAAPAVLVLPAMGVPATYYEPLLLALAARGLCAAAVDLRGVGSSSVRASRRRDFGYDVLAADLAVAVGVLRGRVPSAQVALLGHSLGGQVALLALARGPVPAVRGLVLVASGSPYFRGFDRGRGLGVLAFAALARASGELLGWVPGRAFGLGGREARTLMREWGRLARKGRFVLDAWGGAAPPEEALGQLALPVLAIDVAGDLLAPSPAIEALLVKAARCTVERTTVSAHRAGRAAHHAWARRPDSIADRVVEWLGYDLPVQAGRSLARTT